MLWEASHSRPEDPCTSSLSMPPVRSNRLLALSYFCDYSRGTSISQGDSILTPLRLLAHWGKGASLLAAFLQKMLSHEPWVPLWCHSPLHVSIASTLWDRKTVGPGLWDRETSTAGQMLLLCAVLYKYMNNKLSCPDPWNLVFYFWQAWSFGKLNCLLG